MPRKKFDLIVFDWDGTLMNSTATIVKCIQSAAKDVGLTPPSATAASHVIGLGLSEAMQYLLPGIEAGQFQRMIERYRYHFMADVHGLVLFDDVRSMLAELKEQGYFLAVATGMGRVGLNRSLNATGLLSVFDATRCADETFSKPHPAMLQELTRELGQDMRRTVMIGDTSHDLQMANNAGASGIAVEYGAHPVAQLEACNPVFSASNVAQLRDWLREHA